MKRGWLVIVPLLQGCPGDPDACVRNTVASLPTGTCSVEWACPGDEIVGIQCVTQAGGDASCQCGIGGIPAPQFPGQVPTCGGNTLEAYSALAVAMTDLAIANCFPDLPIDRLEVP